MRIRVVHGGSFSVGREAGGGYGLSMVAVLALAGRRGHEDTRSPLWQF